jgi:hypothetical protein
MTDGEKESRWPMMVGMHVKLPDSPTEEQLVEMDSLEKKLRTDEGFQNFITVGLGVEMIKSSVRKSQ